MKRLPIDFPVPLLPKRIIDTLPLMWQPGETVTIGEAVYVKSRIYEQLQPYDYRRAAAELSGNVEEYEVIIGDEPDDGGGNVGDVLIRHGQTYRRVR